MDSDCWQIQSTLIFIIMKGFFYETLSIKKLIFAAFDCGYLDYVKPFTFNGIRSAIGALFLIPCIFFFQNHTNSSEVSPSDQLNQSSKTHASSSIARKTLFFGGLCCGIVLAAASSLQQIGISYTSVGKAGFLTAIYIVLVPILSLFLKKRCSPLVWLSVALAVCGLYLLSVPDGFGSIGKGDLLFISNRLFFTALQWCGFIVYTVFCMRSRMSYSGIYF